MLEALTLDQRIEQELYLPIQDTDYEIIPELVLLGKDSFKNNLYAQNKKLSILPSSDINTTAFAVEPEEPSKQFTEYALKNSDLKEKDIIYSYNKLHEDIWHKYSIRAKEILVWKSEAHPRLISDDPDATSFLIKDYKIADKDKIDIRGIEPDSIVKVDWLKQTGTITEEMAKLLGARKDTYVWMNTDFQFREGLRALGWVFGSRGRPDLDSNWNPWGRNYLRGSLLGRKKL